jgi:hypothetical protein
MRDKFDLKSQPDIQIMILIQRRCDGVSYLDSQLVILAMQDRLDRHLAQAMVAEVLGQTALGNEGIF